MSFFVSWECMYKYEDQHIIKKKYEDKEKKTILA